MRKTIFVIILTILIGCINDNGPSISNFPTIILQTGMEKTIDLTRYISDLENAIDFQAMFMPTINQDKCTSCGFCISRCPVDAIDIKVL